MKFISLHSKNTNIVYKNTLCSYATLVVLIFIVTSVMIPVILVSLLSPYSGITSSRVLYEQPRVQFKYQHLFVAETSTKDHELVACSTFPSFNTKFSKYSKSCSIAKYWTTDLDHDTNADIAHFKLMLDSIPGNMESFDLVVFFEAKLKQNSSFENGTPKCNYDVETFPFHLKVDSAYSIESHKCLLNPPALLSQHLILPNSAQMPFGSIQIKAELELKQYIEFTCPFPGRSTKTKFRDITLGENITTADDLSEYEIESLVQQLKANPGYFQLNIENIYFRRDTTEGLNIQLDVDIPQLPVRYHLSIWERLGQFWLYFASFFGISFYVMNKIKDFIFGHHIVRSWEIIPWKKLY